MIDSPCATRSASVHSRPSRGNIAQRTRRTRLGSRPEARSRTLRGAECLQCSRRPTSAGSADALDRTRSRFADARSQREDIGMKLKFLATMEGIRDGPDADTSDSLVFGPRGHRRRTCCSAMVTRARWCSLQLRRAPHALCYCLHFAPCTRLCRRRLALRRGLVASGLPAISGEIEEVCSSISTIRRI